MVRGRDMRVTAVIAGCILLVCTGFVSLNAQVPPVPVIVLTFHNNNGRLGLNALETTLTPANVSPATFGKVGFLATDGQVYGQPLFVSNVTVNGSIHNVLYVVTEHDTVYAFDADSGAKLWRTVVLPPGETPGNDPNCGLVKPEIGITSTPIIDLTTGAHGLIY